jgi:far upstream element-binding protein
VNLIGTPAAAAKAKEFILEIVESDTKTMAAGPQETKRETFDPYSGGNSAAKINDTIQVPSDAVGMIIGKGGETIKDMQSTTGCKINVSQASGGTDIEREIGLVGTRQAIEEAKKAIWDKVDSVKQKNGGGYGGNRQAGSRDNGSYGDSYSQQQPSYGQPPAAGQMMPQAQTNPAPQGDGAADPYAVYGGYQNYLAMWYSSFAQQQQQQPAGQGDQQRQ